MTPSYAIDFGRFFRGPPVKFDRFARANCSANAPASVRSLSFAGIDPDRAAQQHRDLRPLTD